MQNYYIAREDKSGDYVTSNHTRYSVSELNPARVHIPAGREGDMVLLDSIEEFLTSMGLVHLDDHTFPEPEPEPVYVPQSVSPSQFRAALNQVEVDGTEDLRSDVEAVVAAADRDTQDRWEYATEIRRDFPMLIVLADLLGLSTLQVDDLFIHAAQL